MHMRILVSLSLVIYALSIAFLLGCGSDDDSTGAPPSCARSVGHFYDAGCEYRDSATGATLAQGTVRAYCERWYDELPARCGDVLDEWLACVDSVPSPVSSVADCACPLEPVQACAAE
jgi:hypothetical protein